MCRHKLYGTGGGGRVAPSDVGIRLFFPLFFFIYPVDMPKSLKTSLGIKKVAFFKSLFR